jgi:hypothetical protein
MTKRKRKGQTTIYKTPKTDQHNDFIKISWKPEKKTLITGKMQIRRNGAKCQS